jgi:hypothetical protein
MSDVSKRVLRDRSKLKKPDVYEPKVDPKDFKDDVSVDSDWDNDKEIDKIEIKDDPEIDGKTRLKDDYKYDDFVVPDDETIESDTKSETESEFEMSENETE